MGYRIQKAALWRSQRNKKWFWRAKWARRGGILGRRRLNLASGQSLSYASASPSFLLAGLRFVLGLAGLALLGWGAAYALCHWNIFHVTDVQVLGARMFAGQQTLKLAGVQPGVNLVTLDTGEAEAKIAAHPWVAEVRVKKQWPASVLVQVREYEPFALVNLTLETGESRLCYLDADGHIIDEVPENGALDYPVINGAAPDDIVNGCLAQGSRAREALQVLRLAARGNALLPLQSVSEVRIAEQKGVVLYLTEHPFPIHFGEGELRQKFGELLRVLKSLYDSGDISRVAALEMEYGDDVNKMLCRLTQSGASVEQDQPQKARVARKGRKAQGI